MTPKPADFGGPCLIGECVFDAQLLMPSSTYFGLEKSGSHFYATLRDRHGNMRRVLRATEADQSMLSWLFVAEPGGQLERHARSEDMWQGPISITRNGDTVEFSSSGEDDGRRYRFVHGPAACSWDETGTLSLAGDLAGPAVQWFNTWDSGACFAVTAKYRVRGTYLGAAVEGFAGHEIHYFTSGFNWLNAPYGLGREFCWQQIANEYDDQSWTWRIDPQGERPALPGIAVIGADGVCTRDGDSRSVRYSMGNSDWWNDGRADGIVKLRPRTTL